MTQRDSDARLRRATSSGSDPSPLSRSGGQTTVIRRVLERRARPAATDPEETGSTLAIMLRVLPPPRAMLAIGDRALRSRLEERLARELLELTVVAEDREALQQLRTEFCPLIVTDSLELIRALRAQPPKRVPFIVYVAEIDEASDREAGLLAGADECVARRVSDRELHARVGAARRIAELEAVLRIALAEHRKLSSTDDLTRVASRRFFSKHFPREVERAARYGRALSLVLCDIDFFKNINDSLGHAGGDEVLRQFGERLQQDLRRGTDWVARIGGEEFAIVLPETGYTHALAVARKLRARVAGNGFTAQGRKIEVTASFGLCGLDQVSGERRLSEQILKVADAALYRSKHAGRNRVTATCLGASSV